MAVDAVTESQRSGRWLIPTGTQLEGQGEALDGALENVL